MSELVSDWLPCVWGGLTSSGSGQEAQVDGLRRDHQDSGFGFHRWGAVLGPNLVVLHQPAQSEVHLHLRHPLPHAGSHAHAERDEAVRMVLVETGRRFGLVVTEPTLREEALRVDELGLVVTGDVVTQVELSLRRQKKKKSSPVVMLKLKDDVPMPSFGSAPSHLLGEPVVVQNDLIV